MSRLLKSREHLVSSPRVACYRVRLWRPPPRPAHLIASSVRGMSGGRRSRSPAPTLTRRQRLQGDHGGANDGGRFARRHHLQEPGLMTCRGC